MKFHLTILVIGLLLGVIFGVQDSFAEQFIEANSKSLSYSVYQNPVILGTVTDELGEPLSKVYVYSYFSSEKAEDMTDENGKFFLRSSEKYPPGEFSVEVYARSGASLSRNVVSFMVQEPIPPEAKITPQLTKAKGGLSIHEMMEQVRSYNLEKQKISIQNQENTTQSLKPQRQLAQNSLTADIEENSREVQIEKQKISIQNQENTTQSLKPQRQLAQNSLTADIEENSREVQIEKNKNSFANFVKTIDLLMHGIFWDQFDFTQKISDEAYEAKTSALEEGKTSLEATKVYQKTAAVPQKDVINYLEEINIKHGFANATIQEQFDDKGKFNRTQTTESKN